jgi:phosphoadenosine phosphosulfate reductase
MEAKDLIKEALSHSNNPKIAFSGGKDSLVVMDLVRKIDPSVGGVFCNTRIEYLETPKYVRTFENFVELKPDRSYNFFKDCKANGIPTPKGKGKGPHSNRCCYKLKEQPAQRSINRMM